VTNRGLSLLRARGLAPKKSFGQHFLHDQKRVARIAELATTPEGGMVLEIGAGVGALTDVLAERAARVVAIERDRDLVPLLRELMAEHENVDRVVFMVQEEVADRIVAAPGGREYGALSVFVQAAFRVERALRIGPGAFSPPPEVSSAVIVLDPLAEPRAEETPLFREVVKGAFATRRKTLRNSWRKLLARDVLEEAAREAGIDLDARAETLSAEDYARMTAVVAALRRDG
jgi:16S rRNA (adenine1518-N6/adenine1519-N6)-dimethyltransferase